MSENKKILITNDDGYDSNGIIRLAKVAKQFGEVWVVAPDGQRSAMSHSLTLRHSVEAWEVSFPVEGVHAYACNGTPADCVRVGALNIVPGRPDYVFSGINYGYNVATDLQYSATVGAAFEASFQKFHTIAFSEAAEDITEVTDEYLVDIIQKLLDKPLTPSQIWNVNFPGCKLSECKGILWDTVVSSDVFYDDIYHEKVLDDGRISYEIEGRRNWNASKETDLWAVLNNYVSVGVANNIG